MLSVDRTLNPIDQIIRNRRSVRGFLPRPVPDEVLHEVFAVAQSAPSNCNVQPWLMHVVSGDACEALRARLVAAGGTLEGASPDFPADGKFHGVYRERQYDTAARLYGAMGVARDDLAGRHAAYLRNQAFFGAPHAAFLFLPEPFGIREATDCGMYAQTLMLAMTARGIASCAQGALSLYPDIVRAHLGIPAEQRLLLGISFGYEDPDVPANAARVGRAALDANVRFHR